MIILNSVSKEIGKGRFKRLILDDIDWVIPPRCHIVILGQRHSGTPMLLDIVAGLAIPTLGWVDRRATVSVPGGLLRYSRHDTARQLIARLSKIYRVDPDEIVRFVMKALPGHDDIMDLPTRGVPPALRQQLNMALTYAFPCDYYLFNSSIVAGQEQDFREFCQRAFALRSRQAGTIVTATTTRVARRYSQRAMGGVLHRGKLTLYVQLADAITVFDSLPPEEPEQADQPSMVEQEPPPEEEEIF
jgi:ABC-type polysaccharide/polyol phosphate transport system ATPase subunit